MKPRIRALGFKTFLMCSSGRSAKQPRVSQETGSTAEGSCRGQAGQQRGQAGVRQHSRGVRQGRGSTAEGSFRGQAGVKQHSIGSGSSISIHGSRHSTEKQADSTLDYTVLEESV